MKMKTPTFQLLATMGLLSGACQQTIIDRTDRAVHKVIEERQRAALGITASAALGSETGAVARTQQMYGFSPRPLAPELPEAFRSSNTPGNGRPAGADDTSVHEAPAEPGVDAASTPIGAEANAQRGSTGTEKSESNQAPEVGPPATEQETPAPKPPLSLSIFSERELDRVTVFGLRDALAYATANARELQDAKEDLYLGALDLTLERHLWTPQFVASIDAQFADYGQVRDFDRAMTVVSDIAVTQRLPYGGEVTARVLNSLMRDLGVHITSGETGTMLFEADIPLLRGAGRVAYESRYLAERELVYAVRAYERFRRTFLVDVAARYFNLQQSKAAISNAHKSYLSRKASWEREDFINRMGRSRTVVDAQRAKDSFRDAEASLVSAKERYESALDRFKIFIAMPVDALLDVVDQDDDAESEGLERLFPDVAEVEAVRVALAYRLDLLNSVDRVDDVRRSVLIAKNQVLPDLDLAGSATLATDGDRKNSVSFNTERTTWRGFVNLRMDDRKRERNAYRQALISLRRAERDHEELVDTVRADVRGALRGLALQADLRMIQRLKMEENMLRWEGAYAQNRLGMITNQEVVDAEVSLLAARNSYAAAVAAFRNAILEFRRDTGTLRITDDGSWQDSGDFTSAGT